MGEKFTWVLNFLTVLIPPDFYTVYQILIVLLSFAFIATVFFSIYRHKHEIKFYQMITREDENGNSRISKVGIAFIFLLILIVYQTISSQQVGGGLVELLGLIFGAELGVKYISNKFNNTPSRTFKNDKFGLSDDD